MKSLRLLLIMVLSVMIPVNGFAAAPVSACPMQATDSAVTVSAAMDCCKDMDTQSPQSMQARPVLQSRRRFLCATGLVSNRAPCLGYRTGTLRLALLQRANRLHLASSPTVLIC